MLAIIGFFIFTWYTSLFTQTFFNHRYASHAAFKMSKGWEKVFFIFAYFTGGPSYLSPRAYAIMHRIHHAYTDTDKDPHSPSYDKSIYAMMVRTWKTYSAIFENKYPAEERFTKNVPDWPAFDRWANGSISRLLWIGAYTAFYIHFAPNLWWFLLLPVQCTMAPVHGAIINWFAHKFGYENFKMKNTSKNLFSIDILMLGESYHNNHHKRPSSINFGYKWHEVDPIYPIILLFGKLGVIQIPKLAPVTENAKQGSLIKEEVLEEETI